MCSPSASAATSGRVTVSMVAFTAFVLFVASLNGLLLLFGGPLAWALIAVLTAWAVKVDTAATDGRGRPVLALRRGWWWDHFGAYFPLSVEHEQPLDAKKRYLFAIHPHGIIGVSAWLSFAADSARLSRNCGDLDVAIATVSINFLMPFWRDLLLAVGFVDASFRSLAAVLKRQRSVAVVIGGAAEALDAHPGTNNIILNKRKGFIRLALVTGTPLVPVFVFGESDLFYQVSNPKGSLLRSIQEAFLSVFKFSPPLIIGAGALGIPFGPLPRPVPLHIVTGEPINVELTPNPTEDDIKTLQATYRAVLEKLYDDHVDHYYEKIVPPDLRKQGPRPALRVIA